MNFFNGLASIGSVVTSGAVIHNGSSGRSTIRFGNHAGTATIDGRQYTGKVIEVRDGQIWVDGKAQDVKDKDGKSITYRPANIEVKGDVQTVQTTSGDISVTGAVGRMQSTSGDVTVEGDCLGTCQTTSGDIKISGAYKCSMAPSTVSGDIRYIKPARK